MEVQAKQIDFFVGSELPTPTSGWVGKIVAIQSGNLTPEVYIGFNNGSGLAFNKFTGDYTLISGYLENVIFNASGSAVLTASGIADGLYIKKDGTTSLTGDWSAQKYIIGSGVISNTVVGSTEAFKFWNGVYDTGEGMIPASLQGYYDRYGWFLSGYFYLNVGQDGVGVSGISTSLLPGSNEILPTQLAVKTNIDSVSGFLQTQIDEKVSASGISTSTQWDYFLDHVESNIAGYNILTENIPTTSGYATRSSTLSAGTTEIVKYITSTNEPSYNSLQKGIISVHLHVEKDSEFGPSNLQIYCALYERKLDTSEVLIATTESSPYIFLNIPTYIYTLDLRTTLADEYTFTSGGRLVLKVFGVVSFGGNATVKIHQEGSTSARVTVSTSTEVLSNTYATIADLSGHIVSNGSSHSFINQAVTSGSYPQFSGLGINCNASGTLDDIKVIDNTPNIMLNLEKYSTNTSYFPRINGAKSNSETLLTLSDTINQTTLFEISALGVKSQLCRAGLIRFVQNGTSSNPFVPGRIDFLTSSSSSTDQLALRIDDAKQTTLFGTLNTSGNLLSDGTNSTTLSALMNVSGALQTQIDNRYTKSEVDSLIGSAQWDYFLDNASSDLGGSYKVLTPTDTLSAETSLSVAGITTVDPTTIGVFATSSTEPSFHNIHQGLISFHIHAEKTAGTKTLNFYCVLVEKKTDTSEIIICTSETSSAVTSKTALDLHGSLANEYNLSTGSRLVLYVYALVSGGGSAVTAVIYMEGTTDSHISVGSSIEALDNKYASKTELYNTEGFLNTKINTISGVLSSGFTAADLLLSGNFINKNGSTPLTSNWVAQNTAQFTQLSVSGVLGLNNALSPTAGLNWVAATSLNISTHVPLFNIINTTEDITQFTIASNYLKWSENVAGLGVERFRITSSGVGFNKAPAWYPGYSVIDVSGSTGGDIGLWGSAGLTTELYNDANKSYLVDYKGSLILRGSGITQITATNNKVTMGTNVSIGLDSYSWARDLVTEALVIERNAMDTNVDIICGSDDIANGPSVGFYRSYSDTPGTIAQGTTNMLLGRIYALGVDGDTLQDFGGEIKFIQSTTNTAGGNQCPTDIVFSAANKTVFNEVMRVNGITKCLMIGGTTPGFGTSSSYDRLLLINAASYLQQNFYCFSDTAAHGIYLNFYKSHSDTEGALVTTISGSILGAMDFYGVGSTSGVAHGASISVQQVGSPGANYMPSDIIFRTDTSSATPERLRIRSDGGIMLATVKSGATQAAAGARATEIWKTAGHATLPDNVLMIGV